jgi:arylsulfatase A-like enzyme
MNRLELLNDTAAKIKTPIIAVLLGVGIACVLILGCGVPPGKTAKQLSQRPNIILVVTDDTRKSDYSRITSLQEAMSPGLYFHNAFATTSLCCPSRATMLTGMYAHNHGIVQHFDPGTGEDQYHANGYDRRDLPNWLKDSGYDTVLILASTSTGTRLRTRTSRLDRVVCGRHASGKLQIK